MAGDVELTSLPIELTIVVATAIVGHTIYAATFWASPFSCNMSMMGGVSGTDLNSLLRPELVRYHETKRQRAKAKGSMIPWQNLCICKDIFKESFIVFFQGFRAIVNIDATRSFWASPFGCNMSIRGVSGID